MKAKLGSITFRGNKRKSFLGMRLRKGFQISEEPGENRDGIEFQKSFRGRAEEFQSCAEEFQRSCRRVSEVVQKSFRGRAEEFQRLCSPVVPKPGCMLQLPGENVRNTDCIYRQRYSMPDVKGGRCRVGHWISSL